jgi:uncharacterized membrane protein
MRYPIKLSLRSELLPVIILVSALAASLYFYGHFPEKVAGHWNFAGQVDRYTGKAEGAFAIPILLIVMYVMFLILPILDPKKERYAEFDHYYKLFRTAILAILFVVYVASGLFNLGYPIKIGYVVSGSIGLLFIVLGNFMGKIKNNWFMGIRTPWTLSSENVWNKTHRLGGKLFVVYGLLMIVTPYLPEALGVSLFILGAIMVVLGTMGYSYWEYRKEQDSKSNNQSG